MSTETLAHDVAWEPSGHLSEVALSVFADGEEGLLDAAMHGHLTGCEACAKRLGTVALRGADVADALSGAAAFVEDVRRALPAEAIARDAPAPVIVPAVANEALNDLATAPATSRPISNRRRLPALPIAAAMAIALLGVLPSLGRVREQASHVWSVLVDVTPMVVRMAPEALLKAWSGPQSARMAPLLWLFAAALVAAGLAIASRASKKLVMDGGSR